MRKIIMISMITIDGVMQAPGGPDEDVSDAFGYGGWTAPHFDEAGEALFKKLMAPSDLLLGRKTFEIFASYWPQHAENWPGINEVKKYVLSGTVNNSGWKNSIFIQGVDDIKKLKNSTGGDIKVWGSSELAQLLFKNDLVDDLWLVTYPLTLGEGKKLFGKGTKPSAFKLAQSVVTTAGVIIAHYQRAGKVVTGTVGT